MPNYIDYARFLSTAAARRQASAIREASTGIYIIINRINLSIFNSL